MKQTHRLTRSRIEAIVILAGSIAYVWEGYRLPAFYRIPGVPGPTLFPTFLGIVMGLAAVWLFFSPDPEAKGDAAPVPRRSIGEHLADRWHFYLMWALLLGYVILMPYLGFVLASFLLMSILFFLLGEKRWYVGIPVAAVFSLAIYFGFAKGLQVRLPGGLLEGLLR